MYGMRGCPSMGKEAGLRPVAVGHRGFKSHPPHQNGGV